MRGGGGGGSSMNEAEGLRQRRPFRSQVITEDSPAQEVKEGRWGPARSLTTEAGRGACRDRGGGAGLAWPGLRGEEGPAVVAGVTGRC